MMELYEDSEGQQVYCYQAVGPTILNTIHGERCAEIGEWVISLLDGRLVVLDNESFVQGFTRVE